MQTTDTVSVFHTTRRGDAVKTVILITENTFTVRDDVGEGGGQTFREVVGCHYLDSTRLIRQDQDPAGDDYVFWFDEEGADNGWPDNELAAKLYQKITGRERIFRGPVLISGLPDDEGDTRGLTAVQVADAVVMLTAVTT